MRLTCREGIFVILLFCLKLSLVDAGSVYAGVNFASAKAAKSATKSYKRYIKAKVLCRKTWDFVFIAMRLPSFRLSNQYSTYVYSLIFWQDEKNLRKLYSLWLTDVKKVTARSGSRASNIFESSGDPVSTQNHLQKLIFFIPDSIYT